MIRKSHGVAFAALALAASGAFAQSTVKLYGYVDAGLASGQAAHESGSSKSVTTISSGNIMTDYFGLAGTDDLGGGLTAGFALESFLDVSSGQTLGNNGGGFWGRTSNVYLSGGFGTVTVGQSDNPLFTFGYTYNPFGSSMAFSPTMRHYYGLYDASASTGGAFHSVSFDTGWVKSVAYATPTWSGFSGVLQWSPKGTTATGSKDSYSLAGTYAQGPLSLSAVYEAAGVEGITSEYPTQQKVWAVGGSYDFSVVKVFAQYAQDKNETTNGLTGTILDNLGKSKIWQLGVSVPAGPSGSVLVSYGQDKFDPTSSGVTPKDKVLSLGYTYTLSKRTTLFAMYAHDSQSDTSNTKAGNLITLGLGTNF
jgi:predicted porin